MERTHSDGRTHASGGRAESHMRMSTGSGPHGSTRAPEATVSSADEPTTIASRLLSFFKGPTSETSSETGMKAIRLVQDRPLIAAATVFALGFALGASSDNSRNHWALERARRRIKTVLVSGVTALLAQELRALVTGDEGLGDLVESYLEEEDEEPDYDA